MNAQINNITTLSLAATISLLTLAASVSQVNASIYSKPVIKEVLCPPAFDCDISLIKQPPNQFPKRLDISLPGTLSSDDESFQVAWSIKGAIKKAGSGLKKVYKKAVPSEIRSGVSIGKKWAKRGVVGTGTVAGKVISHTVRPAGKAILNRVQNPYGKRCKPDRFGRPVCYLPAK